MTRRLHKRPKRRIVAAPFIPNRGQELSYARDLAALCRPMLKRVYSETVKAYREASTAFALHKIGMDSAVDDLLFLLDDFRDEYTGEFDVMALPLAENMVEGQVETVNREFPKIINGALGREYAQYAPNPAPAPVTTLEEPAAVREFFTPPPAEPPPPTAPNPFAIPGNIFDISPQMTVAIKAAIAENVALIKSIPAQYLDQVAGAVTRAMTSASSIRQLADEIKSYSLMTDRRAKNIALDQVRKVHAALNLRRMQDAGITHFKWMHVGGSVKPRPFHIADHPEGLNGGIFSIEDPPVIEPNTGITGFPGDLPFCRCVMQAVIELDD